MGFWILIGAGSGNKHCHRSRVRCLNFVSRKAGPIGAVVAVLPWYRRVMACIAKKNRLSSTRRIDPLEHGHILVANVLGRRRAFFDAAAPPVVAERHAAPATE